ncbi:hypothetical protein F4778DRAFT_741980 [Xylariomycetidae sp. FL2044]|nr:hypothetical protein F4778DRAFT_741980 [Xylariomycetidae sp. FL2044]
MATNQQHKGHPGPNVPVKQENMDQEQQIEDALKQLHILHIRCVGLRTTLGRMLESMPKNANAEEFYRVFLQAVTDAKNEIVAFENLYNSPESKKVLEQARKSREANPKGIKPWRYSQHPDWFRLPK